MAPLQTPARPRPAALPENRPPCRDQPASRGEKPATRAARPRRGPELPRRQDDDWQENGACRTENSSLFFAPDNENPHQRRFRETAAKAICGHCPVRAECRAYALQTGELYGIWGGTTERERARSYLRAPRTSTEALSA